MKIKMNPLASLLVLLLLLLITAPVGAKKTLTHQDYDHWKDLIENQLSNEGHYLSYVIQPQKGDGELSVINLQTNQTFHIERGRGPQFSEDERFLVAKVRPPLEEVRSLKRQKTPKAKLPKDSLVVWSNTREQVLFKTDSISNFSLQSEGSPWLSYTRCFNDKERVSDLHIRLLGDSSEYVYKYVSSFVISKKGGGVAYTTKLITKPEAPARPHAKDSTKLVKKTHKKIIDTLSVNAVYWFDYATKQSIRLDSNQVSYERLTLSEDGDQLVFLSSNDSLTMDPPRHYSLNYYLNQKKQLTIDSTFAGLNPQWMVSTNGDLFFSKSGKRLYFNTCPIPPHVEKDTLLLDEEKAQLDIWSWDQLPQPEQLIELKKKKEKSYQALLDLSTHQLLQLEDSALPQVMCNAKYDFTYAIGYDSKPYDVSNSWDYPSLQDIYAVNLLDGSRKELFSGMPFTLNQSPSSTLAAYYDPSTKSWNTVNLQTGKIFNGTKKIKYPLYDEDCDVPSTPAEYGMLGWCEDNSYFLVKDRFDIWKVYADGVTNAENLTAGFGRKNNIRLSWVKLDKERDYFPQSPDTTLYLKGINQSDFNTYLYKTNLRAQAPSLIEGGAYSYASIAKSKEGSILMFTKGNFQEYPDCYVTDLKAWNPRKMSNTNPQQSDYNWGTVAPMSWKSYSGQKLRGLVYKPEDFDPNKKYPLIVYYYERSLTSLNTHYVPQPQWSIVNITYLVSNGYVVFVPDVVFKTGEPGKSAYDCIISGVDQLAKEPYIDQDHMGLQGQSWGGYETAYLITKTGTRFKAAMAGAPVANMTSAYGGIRWGSGLSREVQYERGQSRIGKTLWEAPKLYIKNSPLFGAPNVQTPLLIMHNDKDDAVPWYQGIEYFMALRRLQKPVWLLQYNNEGHNLRERKNRMDLSIRMMQFFDYYLKGAQEPKWMSQGVPAEDKGKDYGYELMP